jgi:hypothetical protein
MKSTAGACAILIAALACGSAHAEPRQMFCIAVRTVPNLDQDNYVMSASGPVYMTPNFATDLADDELASQWRAYVQPKHPIAYPNNPDDTCQPANGRRALIAAQRGDIRNRSIAWTPAKPAN